MDHAYTLYLFTERGIMKKRSLFILGLSMALFAGVGSNFAPRILDSILTIKRAADNESIAYTLTPATGSNNSYAGNCDVTINGIKWNVTGNASLTPWRIGGKSISNTDRSVYSKTAIVDNISSIELTFGAASSITVNSLTVVVSVNSDFSNPISTLTPSFAANGTVTVNRPNATDWSNCYYKFILNVSVTVNSNKFVEFSEAKFYKLSAQEGEGAITYELDGGINNPQNPSVYKEKEELLLKDPTKEGYRFDGWYVGDDKLDNNTIPSSQTGAITVTAHWTEHPWHKFKALQTEAKMKLRYTTNPSELVDVEYYKLVTSDSFNDDIVDGAQILIVSDTNYAMSTTQNTSNRGSVSLEIDNDTQFEIKPENAELITLEAIENEDGYFGFKTHDDQYLYAASSSANQLKTQNSINNNAKWAINVNEQGVASIVASKSSNRNVMQFNPNGNNPIFSCYATASQTALKVFVKTTEEKLVETYNIASVGLRFRARMTKDLYKSFDDFVNDGTYKSYSFGFDVYKGTKTKDGAVDDNTGTAEVAATNIDIGNSEVKFALVIDNIPSTEWETRLTVYPYVLIDGTEKHYMEQDSYSVVSLANEYVTNHSTQSEVSENIGVLTFLKNYKGN